MTVARPIKLRAKDKLILANLAFTKSLNYDHKVLCKLMRTLPS